MARLQAILAAVRRFYSPVDEPLRRRVYTTLTTLLAAAVTLGVLTGTAAATITTAGAAVLLLVPAAEAARARVTPSWKADPGEHAAPLDGSA